MTDPSVGDSAFIEDAEYHNPWWEGGVRPLADLRSVAGLTPRSDVMECVKAIDEYRSGGTDRLVYPIYGPTGIGKTTLLLQTVAAFLPDSVVEFAPGHREFDVVGAVDPRRVLYVPLEESLYHLERSADAVDQLRRVVDYFRSHVAPRTGREFVLLDDVGALRLDGEEKRVLLELLGEDTYLLFTGILESQVEMDRFSPATGTAIVDARAMLPTKFVDTVQRGEYVGLVDADLAERIEAYRTTSVEGPSYVADVRSGLAERRVGDAVDAVYELYFDALSRADRDRLHEAARAYLRRGGLRHRVEDSTTRNELVQSHFLLYLYKELARYESIQRPENLHRLASLAASRAGEELRYTDVSERLEVDRRTVDAYLRLLEEGISVSESHDFGLQRHRRTRLYLRDPRHVVLLSQRREHHGYEPYERGRALNPEFEHTLAKTVAFDHAARLAHEVGSVAEGVPRVEYAETEAGTVDYVLHDEGFVVPFVLSYHPYAGDAEAVAAAFDPTSGQHSVGGGEELLDLDYEAPVRFVIADSVPESVVNSETLLVERDGVRVCYLPFWLFLLLC